MPFTMQLPSSHVMRKNPICMQAMDAVQQLYRSCYHLSPLLHAACRLLGFNMVRLPFRYRDLDQYWPKDFVSTTAQLSTEFVRTSGSTYATVVARLPGAACTPLLQAPTAWSQHSSLSSI